MASVTFRDGTTIDDSAGQFGLAAGGHRIRFVLSLQKTVETALESKNWASLLGGVVFDGEYSAKEYASGTTAPTGTAKQWASGNQTISGLKSAKAYSEDSFAFSQQAQTSAVQAASTLFSPTADYFFRVYLQSLSAPNAVFSDIPVSLGNRNLDLPTQTSVFPDENIPLFRLNLATGNESINLEI